jgi:hypothetical protein
MATPDDVRESARSLNKIVFEADKGILGSRQCKDISDTHPQRATSPIEFARASDHQVSLFNAIDELACCGLRHFASAMIHPGLTCSTAEVVPEAFA